MAIEAFSGFLESISEECEWDVLLVQECYYDTSNLIFGYLSGHRLPGDTLVLGADFNAELGPKELCEEDQHLGDFSGGVRNERGEWLALLAAQHGLAFYRTFCRRGGAPARYAFGPDHTLDHGPIIDGFM
eukprot:9478863-Pyramimonas_sp.AAC.1